MKFSRSIHAIDSHTMGEPTRIIVGGIPNIKGNTMAEKKEYLEKNLDYLRTAIMLEPRGHNDMFGSIITQPCHTAADFGIIFMDGGGYLNMCGHGSIGAITIAIETGMVKMIQPVTYVKMDTPAGIIEAQAKIVDEKVKEVSFVNVPSFLYKRDCKIKMESYGEINFDIAFGGSFFAIVNANKFGVKIESKNAQLLNKIGMEMRDIVNKEINVQHPILKHIKTVDLVEIYDEPTNLQANYKNAVIFGQGQIDRSPCGTGTSAKLATLYAKGEIKKNEEVVSESILGTLFKGKIVGIDKVGKFNAVRPEITASAYITGFNHFVIDEDDPVKYGFILK